MPYKPYSIFAEYYDQIMNEVSYCEWIDYLERIFKKYNIEAESIIDLGCGTGSVSTILAEREYEVVGLDLSSEMLDKAKAKKTPDLSVSYIEGDMRDFNLNRKFDVAVSLFDSLNYILDQSELAQVFHSTYEVLKSDGYFIFDINSAERIKSIKPGVSWYEGSNYLCLWRDFVYPKKQLWKAELTFLSKDEEGRYLQKKECHLERGYSLENLVNILRKEGFRNRAVYEAYTFNRVKEGSHPVSRLFFVTQKG